MYQTVSRRFVSHECVPLSHHLVLSIIQAVKYFFIFCLFLLCNRSLCRLRRHHYHPHHHFPSLLLCTSGLFADQMSSSLFLSSTLFYSLSLFSLVFPLLFLLLFLCVFLLLSFSLSPLISSSFFHLFSLSLPVMTYAARFSQQKQRTLPLKEMNGFPIINH